MPLAQPVPPHLDLVRLGDDDILAQADRLPMRGIFQAVLRLLESLRVVADHPLPDTS